MLTQVRDQILAVILFLETSKDHLRALDVLLCKQLDSSEDRHVEAPTSGVFRRGMLWQSSSARTRVLQVPANIDVHVCMLAEHEVGCQGGRPKPCWHLKNPFRNTRA